MLQSSKVLPMFLLFGFMAAALVWVVVRSWGGFDVAESISGRSFFGNDETDAPAAQTPTPSSTPGAARVDMVDRYPTVRLSPNPKPLYAP
jgi:hypothetical protein